jgi:predicted Zn-dependent peptidase
MADVETLSVSVVAGRGARAEAPDQSGWAHLLEHMVF